MALIDKSSINLSDEERIIVNLISGCTILRTMTLSVTIAKVIVDKLILPASPVSDPRFFYSQTLRINTINSINAINEKYGIDTDTVEKLIEDLYVAKYNVVYPDPKVSYISDTSPERAALTFFNIGDSISNELISEIINNKAIINMYYNPISTLLYGGQDENVG